jgi:P4 family phage/plasmid primase-like protien
MTTTNPKNCQENDAELERKKESFQKVESVEPSMLEASLWLARRGRPVFPIYQTIEGICTCHDKENCKSPGKHPLNKLAPNGLSDATLDLKKIEKWWSAYPDANIGELQGGDRIALDFDGPEGEAILKDLEAKHGKLPETLEVKTGKGRHLRFKKPLNVHIQSVNGKFGKGFDIKSDGGYVVAPPSLHYTGRRYQYTDISIPRADLPEAWVKALSEKEPAKTEKGKKFFVLPDIVEQGSGKGREPVMLSYVGKLWSEGFSKDEITTMAHAVNQERFKPPLEDHIVDNKIERVTTKYQQGTHKVRGLGAGKRFYPADWIKALREKYHLLYHNKRFYYYENGYYKEVDEDARGVLIESLGGPELRQHNFKEIYYKLGIKLTADQEGREVDSQWILNLKNGWIDLRDKTFPIKPHDPKLLTTFINFISYKSDATCNEFNKFLARQFPDPKLRALIWEMIGYLLIPSTKFQVGFFFKGPTETGKTTLLNIIIALLGGDDRCSHVALEKFGDRFSLSDIEGKLVNIDDETEFKKSWADKPVKQVISGVKITVEAKMEKARTIKPTARLIVASNDFPHTADTTTAFFRRWIVIPAIVPRPEQPDINLEERIIKNELEGILVKAIAGLAILLENEKFTIPESCVAMKNEWEEKVDLVQYWANRCLVQKENHREPWPSLVEDCNAFILDEGLKAQFSRRSFNERMKNLGFKETPVDGYGFLKNYKLKTSPKTRNLQVAQI